MTPAIDAIKAELRKAKTPAEVEAIADRHRDTVRELHRSPASDLRAQAIQIAQLKAYILQGME